MPAADCGLSFTSSNGDRLADAIQRCRLNSKSLANLLCPIARSASRRTGQDREAPGSKITGSVCQRLYHRNIEDFSGLECVVEIVEVRA
jgi:hypothetical protein